MIKKIIDTVETRNYDNTVAKKLSCFEEVAIFIKNFIYCIFKQNALKRIQFEK